MVVIRDDTGAVEYMIGMVEDISSRKKTEAELIAAQSKAEEMTLLKSSFLTNMSHELRTPMMGIRGVLDILQDNPVIVSEAEGILEDLDSSSRALMTLLDDVLDLHHGSPQIPCWV